MTTRVRTCGRRPLLQSMRLPGRHQRDGRPPHAQPLRRGPAWWPRTLRSKSCSNHFSPASTSVSPSSNTASSNTGFGCRGQTCSSRTFVNGATPCSAHGVDRHQRRLLDSPGRSDGWKRRDSLSWSRDRVPEPGGTTSRSATGRVRPAQRALFSPGPCSAPPRAALPSGPTTTGPFSTPPDLRTDHDPLRQHDTPADHSPQLRCGRLRSGWGPRRRRRHAAATRSSREWLRAGSDPLETVDPGLDRFGQRVPGAVRHGHLARRADDTSMMPVTAGLGSVALALR